VRVGRIALLASLVVFAQVSLGAWYRHGLRAEADGGSELRFALHFLGAAVTTALVVMLATSLKRAANEIGASSAVADALRGVAKRLHLLLGLQLLLGLAAWAGYREGAIGPAEWSLSILHVLLGAMLLAQCAVAFAWSRRAHAAPESLGAMALGGAR